jgi:hypothetical protein
VKFGRGHADNQDHHEGERIVVLAELPTRFEADVVTAALEAGGIKASAVHSDAGGWAPNLSAYVGHRVMVFEDDYEAARALMDSEQLTDEAAFDTNE